MRTATTRAATGALTAALVGLSACGPSFQATYEGEARFEHCYALDERPEVARDAKERCWSDWKQSYAAGQNRDRVAYAATRAERLRAVAEAPTDEALMLAVPGQPLGAGGTVAAPAPTSALAPPPARLAPPPAVSVAASEPSAPLPLAPCTDGCATNFHVCDTARAVDGHGGGRADCSGSYSRCMAACFKR